MNVTAIPTDALNRFRHAASLLTREAPSRTSRLFVVREEIATLRKRGVSYRSISDLLTQNGISASDVTVMKFCHHYLNEKRRRKTAKRRLPLVAPAPASTAAKSPPAPSQTSAFSSRGPRIAKIEQLPPGETI